MTMTITEPPREQYRYARCSAAVLNARRDVVRTVSAWELPELVEAAAQIVSELVANVVQHASGYDVRVSVERPDDATVTIMVVDSSRVLPTVDTPEDGAEGGRGLLLVAEFADEWGATPVHGGKRVWARLKVTS